MTPSSDRTVLASIGYRLAEADVVAAQRAHLNRLFSVPYRWHSVLPLFYALGQMMVPFRVRELLRDKRVLQQEWQVELSEAGLRAFTAGRDVHVPWSDYIDYWEDDRVILLYRQKAQYQVIPVAAANPDFLKVLHRKLAASPRD
ncbi:YcxB family protein [Bradyrhizobium sp. U87765 SZCCT0131]|uniref:YcxB family protein n=1 Tax=unclassified Bradyrhizobium TaxID=2631580 RepID=UPI001BACF752|nr:MULTISPECIES: YcxB family protein [unclassified Bradyrhizobium]MBR1216967.1 YcxB family protein [Bradyrhizobium sp. U87765 SZCCT0131]MBR1259277.1 YcxB family protein [Bradyrhizobium sp. U87765 SZCCT0134]MBR1305418.1 YcxB family protein [Bradyrhizobium sp. U87765 SZCCT0110]MBR1321204.1 YcxB family protein [Bradyrhizobium sp. U87765 SZCCT0109]MBR1350142.1 YcxB family protein [Bradyrhizobium sp. U87765 SZCCT0048]